MADAADALPRASFVLIGDVGEGDPHTDITLLSSKPNIHLLGPRPYDQLPSYLKGIDVALLPSRLNDYTKNMFPMKFYEYVAANKPIVATNLHALAGMPDLVTLTRTTDEFIDALKEAASHPARHAKARLKAADGMSYKARNDVMIELIGLPTSSRKSPL